jgi:hypothetical protein
VGSGEREGADKRSKKRRWAITARKKRGGKIKKKP